MYNPLSEMMSSSCGPAIPTKDAAANAASPHGHGRMSFARLLVVATVFTSSAAFESRSGQDPASVDLSGVRVETDIPYLGPVATEKLDLYQPERLEKGKS